MHQSIFQRRALLSELANFKLDCIKLPASLPEKRKRKSYQVVIVTNQGSEKRLPNMLIYYIRVTILPAYPLDSRAAI